MPAGWVAAAAAVVGGVASAVGASNAASDQEAAANNATALQSQIYNQTVTRNQPFVTAGTGAVNTLADDLGTSGNTNAAGYGSLTGSFTPADYLANQDPGYGFQLKTGQQAVANQSAAGGSALGGAALKGLDAFSQGYAATGYQNAFDRYQTQQGNIYNRLAGLAGIGQASANNTAASGNAFGANAGSNIIGAGNAAAAGTVGIANAFSNTANSAAGYYALNGGYGGSSSPATTDATTAGGYTNPDGSLITTG